MKISELFSIIESVEFDANAGLASGFDSFCQIISRTDSFRDLTKKVRDSQDIKDAVLSRIELLSRREVDPRYVNLFDSAFATYLQSLSLVDTTYAQEAALLVSKVENCNWARTLSHHLLSYVEADAARSEVPTIRCEEIPKKSNVQSFSSSQSGTQFQTFILTEGRSAKSALRRKGQSAEIRITLSIEKENPSISSHHTAVSQTIFSL